MTGGKWSLRRTERRRTPRRTITTTTAALAAGVLSAALITVGPTAGPASSAPPDARERAAKPPPQVGLEIPVQDVDAGAPFEVRVTSKRVGKGKVLLKRRTPGNRTWVKVAKLGKRGVFTAPGVDVGTYTYRLEVKRKGQILAKSKGRQLRSYGDLGLQQLCTSPGTTISTCADGTATVGGSPFTYRAYSVNTGTDQTVAPSAVFTNSSCRSITLSYAVADGSGATSASVSLTQDKGGAPQTSTVPVGTVGSATFQIGSKGWDLRFWTAVVAAAVHWDATLDCFTTNGVRKSG